MKKTVFFLLLTLTSIFAFSFAKSENEALYRIKTPENWKSVRGLFGLSHSLLGPNKDKMGRAVISIERLTPEDFPIDYFSESGLVDSYQENKIDWVESRGGEIFRFLESFDKNFSSISEGKVVYSIGVSYILEQKSFIEKNFYLNCPSGIFVFKYLSPLIIHDQYYPKAIESLKSFRCRK